MKDKLLMILFVLVLGSILSTSLVLVDHYTEPIIDENVSLKLKSSVLGALSIDFEGQNVDRAFDNNVAERSAADKTYYVSARGDIALPFTGSGLWGPITGILALKPDLREIMGITIIHQEETPGLGSRIAETEYLAKFVGKQFNPKLRVVTPGRASAEDEIDSISGATMSSNAFVGILNSQYGEYLDDMEAGR